MPLVACGSNGSGQLAIGHDEDVSSFTPCVFDPSCPTWAVSEDCEIVDLVSAASHALLLIRLRSQDPAATPRNVLLGAGTNTHGQLGLRCALTDSPTVATSFRPFSLARDAGLDDTWEPVKVAATWTTSFVVYERQGHHATGPFPEQVVVAGGSNDFGEIGVAPSKPAVMRVDAALQDGEWVEHLHGGQRHVVAVVSHGHGDNRTQRVVGWGAARRGELSAVPLPPPTRGTKGKGKAVATPTTLPPTPINLAIPSGTHVIDLALGAAHSIALCANGTVLAWGSDAKGQITGLTSSSSSLSSPSSLPSMITDVRCIGATWGGSYLLTGDAIWSQGGNTHGQLLRHTPADANSGASRADDHDNNAAARGPVLLPDHDAVTSALVAGSEHVLVVADGGKTLYTGGWNEHGNLGVGDTVDRGRLVPAGVGQGLDSGARTIVRVWGGCAASWVWTR